MKSVLQDWVMELPLRYQGTLLTAVRGCDLSPKTFDRERGDGVTLDVIETSERRLTAFIRFCFMNAADVREVDVQGAFFQSRAPFPFKFSELGHYPLHWVSHVMHAIEIIAYKHPDEAIRSSALFIYSAMVHGLHLNTESEAQLHARMTEDRIATGTVVS